MSNLITIVAAPLLLAGLAAYLKVASIMVRKATERRLSGDYDPDSYTAFAFASISGFTFGTGFMFGIGSLMHFTVNWGSTVWYDGTVSAPDDWPGYPRDELWLIEWPWWVLGLLTAAPLILLGVGGFAYLVTRSLKDIQRLP